MGNEYSQYTKEAQKLPPTVCVMYYIPRKIFGINLSQEIINGIQQVYTEVFKRPIYKIMFYNVNLVEFEFHKFVWFELPNAANSVLSKQIFCRFHKLFSANGWNILTSPTLTFELSLSSWFYYKDPYPYTICTDTVKKEFCAISLSGCDRFQFIDFPPDLQDSITSCVASNYSKGIQDKGAVENTENAWTIKLRGFPWVSDSCNEASIEARNLVLSLIRFMSDHNWRLMNSATMKWNSADTLFFRNVSHTFEVKCPETMPEYYFLLALMDRNKLVVLGGDQNIKNTIGSCCARFEERGIQPLDVIKNYPAIILNTNVWSRMGEKELETRRLMTLIFQDLASIGWLPSESLHCSRSITDLSSIVFVRTQPVRMMYFCLCPKKFNGISLVNAPEDVINVVYSTFIKYYPIQSQNIRRQPYGVGTVISFTGEPFLNNQIAVLLFQQTLAVAINSLKDCGWILMLAADTSDETLTRSKGEKSSETIKYSIHGLWFSKIVP